MQFNQTTSDPVVTVRRSTVVIGAILGFFVVKQIARTNYVEGYADALAEAAKNLTNS